MDEAKLAAYLKRCELQYRADHTEGAAELPWLAPFCGTVQEIASFLRGLGFRVRRIVDEEPWPGEVHRWVETTSGVIVYAETNGLFARAYGKGC